MSLPGSSTQTAQAAPITQVAQAAPVTQQNTNMGFSELPSRNCRKAPKFDRDTPEELLWYIEDVEFCLQAAGITDVAKMKEVSRKYADFRTANDWTTLKSYKNGTWEEYMAPLLVSIRFARSTKI